MNDLLNFLAGVKMLASLESPDRWGLVVRECDDLIERIVAGDKTLSIGDSPIFALQAADSISTYKINPGDPEIP